VLSLGDQLEACDNAAVGRLTEIDALRGVAAAIVAFLFHQHFVLGVFRTGPLDGLPVFTWIHVYGWTMVDLFFVISGFIFSYVYLADGRMRATLRQFVVARFARLYPLHFAMLLASGLIFAFGQPATAGRVSADAWHFLLNLLMLQESGLNEGLSFNAPAWSISVEVFCYAAFFLIASHSKLPLLAACLATMGFIATAGPDPHIDHIARGLCGFFVGVLVHRHRNAPPIVPILLLAFGLLAIQLRTSISIGAILSFTCWPALVMLAPRLFFLRWSALRWLGDRSYSIYMIHAPIYWGINILVFGSQPVPPAIIWPALILTITLILGLSDLSYRYMEEPARRYIRRGFCDRKLASAKI
jgi:Predicted acyltransferases